MNLFNEYASRWMQASSAWLPLWLSAAVCMHMALIWRLGTAITNSITFREFHAHLSSTG